MEPMSVRTFIAVFGMCLTSTEIAEDAGEENVSRLLIDLRGLLADYTVLPFRISLRPG